RELQLTREIPRSTRATCPRNGHRRYNRASGGRIALTPQMRTIEHIVASKRHRPPRASDWQWTSTPQVCCREEHQSGEDLPLSGSDRQEFRFRSERAFPNECAVGTVTNNPHPSRQEFSITGIETTARGGKN